MQTQTPQELSETWVRVLKKGIVTLPKSMREKVGIKEGDVAKAKLVGNTIVIEPREEVSYRIFTDEEIERWKEEDKLSPELEQETKELMEEAFPNLP
jgi:AbrB family looped-hinge helix DNA binding protein